MDRALVAVAHAVVLVAVAHTSANNLTKMLFANCAVAAKTGLRVAKPLLGHVIYGRIAKTG
jgi:hypothetical protein